MILTFDPNFQRDIQVYRPPKCHSSPLKIHGWKMTFLLGRQEAYFQRQTAGFGGVYNPSIRPGSFLARGLLWGPGPLKFALNSHVLTRWAASPSI